VTGAVLEDFVPGVHNSKVEHQSIHYFLLGEGVFQILFLFKRKISICFTRFFGHYHPFKKAQSAPS
jgi:hypothetical protein